MRITCALFSLCIGMAVASVALALDMSALPFLSEPSKEAIEKHINSVGRECRLSYTVAIAKSGAWGAYCGGRLSTEDVRRNALEKCEHIAQEPCGTAVVGGRVVEFQEFPQNIRYPDTFTASAVPFVSTKGRNQLSRDYESAGGYKALAISKNGAYGYVTGRSSDSEAKKAALNFCEKHDHRRKHCIIYAVGSDVMFDMFSNIFPKGDAR